MTGDEELEGLGEETLAALSDPDLMVQVREGEAAIAAGDVVSLDELRDHLGRRRRRAG